MVEADKLHGDLALVVIHGYDGVEVAASSCNEYGVGRIGAARIHAHGLGFFHGGLDDFDFFHAYRSAVAGMRIQAGKGNRSEERRVGKESVSTCRFRWSPYH